MDDGSEMRNVTSSDRAPCRSSRRARARFRCPGPDRTCWLRGWPWTPRAARTTAWYFPATRPRSSNGDRRSSRTSGHSWPGLPAGSPRGMARLALAARFMMTCWIWVASAMIAGRCVCLANLVGTVVGRTLRRMRSVPFSSGSSSTGFSSGLTPLAKVSRARASCPRSGGRRAAPRAGPRKGDDRGSRASSDRPTLPRITVSSLLRSWAMKPARAPQHLQLLLFAKLVGQFRLPRRFRCCHVLIHAFPC